MPPPRVARTPLPALLAALSVTGASPAVAETRAVSVAVVGAPAGPAADELRRAIRDAVARRPGLLLVDEATERRWFQSTGPAEPGAALANAEKYLRRAQRAFREFRLDDAKKSIRRTDAALEPWRGHPDARDVDRAHLVLAISIAHAQRDLEALEEGLAAYARRFGHEGPPPESGWPPDLSDRLVALTRFGNEVLHVLTRPKAEVFLDGRRVGDTPLTLGDLEPGPHRIVLRAPGFFPADVPVHVERGKPASLELELPPRLSERLPETAAQGPVPPELADALRRALPPSTLLVLAGRAQERVVLRLVDLAGAQAAPREVTVERLAPEPLDEALDALFAELGGARPAAARPLRVPAWAFVSGGLGLAAVGVGTALRLSAASDQSELATNLSGLTQVEAYAARDDAAAKADFGTVFIGTGAVVLVGTAAYVFIDWLLGGQQ